MSFYNGKNKVELGEDSVGTVHLGFGRGKVHFKKNSEGKIVEWWLPEEKEPHVEAALIKRARDIYKKECPEEWIDAKPF